MVVRAVPYDMVRVEGVLDGGGFSLPRLTLRERRAGHPTMLRWVMQRHVEVILYDREDGGSTGAIWKLLSMTGLGRTALIVNKASVHMGIVTTAEQKDVLEVFRSTSCRSIDPCSLGRVRSCTLLPVATVACVCRTFGRSPASMALLRALSQPIPESWELAAQRGPPRSRAPTNLRWLSPLLALSSLSPLSQADSLQPLGAPRPLMQMSPAGRSIGEAANPRERAQTAHLAPAVPDPSCRHGTPRSRRLWPPVLPLRRHAHTRMFELKRCAPLSPVRGPGWNGRCRHRFLPREVAQGDA